MRDGTSTWGFTALREAWVRVGATGTADDGRVGVAVVAEVDVTADIGPRVGDLASTVPAVVSSFVTCSPSASRIPSPFLAGKLFFFIL